MHVISFKGIKTTTNDESEGMTGKLGENWNRESNDGRLRGNVLVLPRPKHPCIHLLRRRDQTGILLGYHVAGRAAKQSEK